MKLKILRSLSYLLLFTVVNSLCAQTESISRFIDKPLEEPVSHPDWFKVSFLDLYDDIDEAVASGKKGIIVYFGQEYCPYCKAHLEINWGNPDIIKYTRDNFDVVAIDVKGSRNVTDINGIVYEENAYSVKEHTNFTPSLLFYNDRKQVVLKLQGYHPPYQFRAALEYVSDRHYERESFRDYLGRAEMAESYGEDKLNPNPAFMSPPYLLDRSHIQAAGPMAVFFEQKRCHACDILHAGPLNNAEIKGRLKQIDVIQLDSYSDTKVLTPNGNRTTAREWAEDLDVYYSPTIIFFDENGKEIIRINSVVWVYRLKNVLEYVLTGAYKKYQTYQLWRQHMGRAKSGIQ